MPPDSIVQFYVRSRYGSDTRNIPLFLPCRQVHDEAEHPFYRSTTFASSIARCEESFLAFLKNRSPDLPAKISHVRILGQADLSHDLMESLADEMSLV